MKESYSAVNIRPFHERRLLLDLQRDYDGSNIYILKFKRIIGARGENNFALTTQLLKHAHKYLNIIYYIIYSGVSRVFFLLRWKGGRLGGVEN